MQFGNMPVHNRITATVLLFILFPVHLKSSWFPYLVTYLLHAAESFLRSWTVLSRSRNSAHFMEPEGSLPRVQMPTTCSYPEPDQSSPCPLPTRFLKIHLNIILPSTPEASKWSKILILNENKFHNTQPRLARFTFTDQCLSETGQHFVHYNMTVVQSRITVEKRQHWTRRFFSSANWT
jgi:hypothetical protein